MRIAFIGGGNMATALISSLFASRHIVDRVQVADPGEGVRERLQKRWPVHCFETAAEAIKGMNAIVLAVKPLARSRVRPTLTAVGGGGSAAGRHSGAALQGPEERQAG